MIGPRQTENDRVSGGSLCRLHILALALQSLLPHRSQQSPGATKMKIKPRIALSTMFAAFVLTMAQFASAGDVSGTWIMDVQTPAGSGKPTFVLVQKGADLSGTYKGAM